MIGNPARQMEAHQSRRQGRMLVRVLIGSFLIILTAMVIVISISQNAELARLADRKAELLAERERLAVIDADLKHLQSMSDTDAYWEHVARNQLGMARPQEIIIRIDD